MNKNELKKTLKPLIKECIKEVIFEEGVLSGIISEVVKGTGSQRIVETRQPVPQRQPQPQVDYEAQERKRKDQRRKMLDSIGRDSYNGVDLFEGTQPLNERNAGRTASPHGSKALDGVAPNDPGVDLSAFGMNPAIWKKLAKG